MGTLIKSDLDNLIETLIQDHTAIKKELENWKKQIQTEPSLNNLNNFINYYKMRVAAHAAHEEKDLPVNADNSNTHIDMEAFRFSHGNLDYHIAGLQETLDKGKSAATETIIREVYEMCDLIDNHFHEEEHHLFPRDMEEIYEISGPGD
jgi:hypothetical protein